MNEKKFQKEICSIEGVMAIVNSIAAIIYEVERIVIHFYYNSIRT